MSWRRDHASLLPMTELAAVQALVLLIEEAPGPSHGRYPPCPECSAAPAPETAVPSVQDHRRHNAGAVAPSMLRGIESELFGTRAAPGLARTGSHRPRARGVWSRR
jgi:hypothetical protein